MCVLCVCVCGAGGGGWGSSVQLESTGDGPQFSLYLGVCSLNCRLQRGIPQALLLWGATES